MASKTLWESVEGSPYPLGATYIQEEDAFNFAIYSRNATSILLLIYSDKNFSVPIFTYDFDYLINKSNRIWHCRIKATDIGEGKYYAYKIDGPGPVSQVEWHAFDKQKVLFDPYAKSIFFSPAYDRKAACLPGPNDGKAPLGIIIKENNHFDWQNDKYVCHESDLVIYELHVKGFTFHSSSGTSEGTKGTFYGIVEKIPYLKELGITAIELMPVHQFDIQANEYWGYNTLNFFSPHSAYARRVDVDGQLTEFKTMVRELHKAGIEVILDVVFNHTAEGSHEGPTFSYKGIDNSTYYLINKDITDPYFNYSGTGNTLHTRNSYVRRMILDSLHYWRSEMHIDGFRFDLASIFCRNEDGTISYEEPAVLGMISSDPDLATARFIAEPWDAVGAFQLGKKFPGVKWMQWNSSFRDDVRRFVRGDEGCVDSLISRIYGSEDLFSDDLQNACHASDSINYITCHDGFTLYDLVSYNQKNNFANGNDNTDGATENYSWNCGKEGDENVPADIMQLRRQQAKNFCTLLFISNGTPMFVAGDEFLRTQKGNNNPYNQDNETSWIDWGLLKENNHFFQFFKKMITFRKAHSSLCRSRFWRQDVKWFGVNGNIDNSFYSKAVSFYLNGAKENDDDIYVMVNSYWENLTFTFQIPGKWHRIINTALSHPNDFVDFGKDIITANEYNVSSRSVCVFLREKEVAF
ncbi:glycogen debranching protein [Segetibacter koreensis]|uniref:glycogen debranching protein n=1 Tax=Segetibacter koreensis TaxID=398037 RepID=UPI00037E54EA|nr:isoamylase [Segetibacter koreensis]